MTNKTEKQRRKHLFKSKYKTEPKLMYSEDHLIGPEKLFQDILKIEDSCFSFYTYPEKVNSAQLIKKAEDFLNIKFPTSYKYFLQEYQYASIGKDRYIYGLFDWNYEDGLNSSEIIYEDCDLIWNYLIYKKNNLADNNSLYFANFIDFIYYFKIQPNNDEYLIYELEEDYWSADNQKLDVYAHNFYEFIVKVINSC
jgi:hypothetical protein